MHRLKWQVIFFPGQSTIYWVPETSLGHYNLAWISVLTKQNIDRLNSQLQGHTCILTSIKWRENIDEVLFPQQLLHVAKYIGPPNRLTGYRACMFDEMMSFNTCLAIFLLMIWATVQKLHLLRFSLKRCCTVKCLRALYRVKCSCNSVCLFLQH